MAMAEDPGWLKIAGARATQRKISLDLEAYRAWLRSEATLRAADAWVHARTEIRQRINPALPPWRDLVRWAIEFALLQGPGDPHRTVYLGQEALDQAIEFHDHREEAACSSLRGKGETLFVVGPIHWQWILAWVGENLPFPDRPPTGAYRS